MKSILTVQLLSHMKKSIFINMLSHLDLCQYGHVNIGHLLHFTLFSNTALST